MQTNPAVEQNKNTKWSESPWNQITDRQTNAEYNVTSWQRGTYVNNLSTVVI